jgi:hypothetical protein
MLDEIDNQKLRIFLKLTKMEKYLFIYLISHINAGASNFEICNGWRNAKLFACQGFDSASKCPGF